MQPDINIASMIASNIEFAIYMGLALIPWLGISWMLGTSNSRGWNDQKIVKAFWLIIGIPTYAAMNILIALSFIHMHQGSSLEIWTTSLLPLIIIALFVLGLHLAGERKLYWVVAIGFNYLFSLVDEVNLVFSCFHTAGSTVFEQPYKANAGMARFATLMTGLALFTLSAGTRHQKVKTLPITESPNAGELDRDQ